MYNLRMRPFRTLRASLQFVDIESRFRDFAEYCRLRDQGLRTQALESLNQFVTEAAQWVLSERIVFVDAALFSPASWDGMRIPQPMVDKLIMPTLNEWMAESPEACAPRRWFGMLTHDVRPLEEALALDPTDQVALHAVTEILIDSVEYAVHELPCGYLGDPDEDYEVLRRAEPYVSALEDPKQRESRMEALHSLKNTVESYLDFVRSGTVESFEEWVQRDNPAVRSRRPRERE